jgi:multidrug efflux pump subunit AcrA (membrane-fusion protein)
MAQASILGKKSQVESIKNSIKTKQNLLSYSKILSPIDGEIGTIFSKEGSLSAPGKPIMEIIGDKKRLLFSYTQNTPIKVGQEVKVGEFKEKITSIYPNAKNALTTAEVLLTHDLALPIGSTTNIEVIFGKKTGTAVPLNALLHDNEVSVMVFKNNHFEKTAVKVEISNDEFAIITPAIKEPVAIGSEAKLSTLASIKNVKVVFDEKK